MNAQDEFDFTAPLPRMTATEAMEKIKRLLRLGRSPNPHEAALALEKAFAFAQKYRIDVSALDLDEETERLTHEWFKVGLRLSFLQKRAINIAVSFFNVDACLSAPRVVFVGLPADIAIAWYVYEFLTQQGRAWLRDYNLQEKAARRKVSTVKSRSFVQGFIYGIAEQLRSRQGKIILEDSKTAIVLAEQKREREVHLDDLIPKTRSLKIDAGRRNTSALMQGYERGKATRINQPLNGGERLALQAAS